MMRPKRQAPSSPKNASKRKKKNPQASPTTEASSPAAKRHATPKSPSPNDASSQLHSSQEHSIHVQNREGIEHVLPRTPRSPKVKEVDRARFINRWMKQISKKDKSQSARFLAQITSDDGMLLSRQAMKEIKDLMQDRRIDVDVIALSRLGPDHLSRLNVDKNYRQLGDWKFMEPLWERLVEYNPVYHRVGDVVERLLRDWPNLPTWVYKHEYASRQLIDLIIRQIEFQATAAGDNVVTCPELSLSSSARCSAIKSEANPAQTTYCPGSVDYCLLHWPSSRVEEEDLHLDHQDDSKPEDENTPSNDVEGESDRVRLAQGIKMMLSRFKEPPVLTTINEKDEEDLEGSDVVHSHGSPMGSGNNGGGGSSGDESQGDSAEEGDEAEGQSEDEPQNESEDESEDTDYSDEDVLAPLAGVAAADAASRAAKDSDASSVAEMVDLLAHTKIEDGFPSFPGQATGVRITSIEAKNIDEDLMDHVPQAIGQSLLLADRAGTTTDQDVIPFCLSNGFEWIFGVLARDAGMAGGLENRTPIYRCYLSPKRTLDIYGPEREIEKHQDLVDVVKYLIIWIAKDAPDIVSTVRTHYGSTSS